MWVEIDADKTHMLSDSTLVSLEDRLQEEVLFEYPLAPYQVCVSCKQEGHTSHDCTKDKSKAI